MYNSGRHTLHSRTNRIGSLCGVNLRPASDNTWILYHKRGKVPHKIICFAWLSIKMAFEEQVKYENDDKYKVDSFDNLLIYIYFSQVVIPRMRRFCGLIPVSTSRVAPVYLVAITNTDWQCTTYKRASGWGRDKVVAISQTTFSNEFSWMKIYEFRFMFHWGLFLRFKLAIFHHWFR